MSDDERLVTIGRDQYGPAEIEWAQNRPAEHRIPLPAVGQEILVRTNDWTDPVPARVTAVNVDPGHPSMLLGDPWPVIEVRMLSLWGMDKLDARGRPRKDSAGPRPYLVRCQEARLAGTAGWLPLDWESHYRPPHLSLVTDPMAR